MVPFALSDWAVLTASSVLQTSITQHTKITHVGCGRASGSQSFVPGFVPGMPFVMRTD